MSEITWIKVSLGLFDGDKIKVIESMPDKDALLIIWVKLLIQAGKSNAGGYVQITDSVPYTDEMLSSVFGRPLNTIRLALATFQKFEMIDIEPEHGIFITNWNKYQNIETLEHIKEGDARRSREYRARLKDKLLLSQNASPSHDATHDATHDESYHVMKQNKNIDIDIRTKTKNKNNTKVMSEIKFSDESLEINLAIKLRELILKNNPGTKVPQGGQLQKWAYEIDKMLRIDKRPESEIIAVIEFCQADPFWIRNVLSAEKLRKQYDTLNAQRLHPKEKNYGQEKKGDYGANQRYSEPPGGRQASNEELQKSYDDFHA
jgi:predicted phage replisome organizer